MDKSAESTTANGGNPTQPLGVSAIPEERRIKELEAEVERLKREKRKAERLLLGKPAPVRIHIPKEAHGQLEWIFEPARLTQKDLVETSIGQDGQEVWTYRKEKENWVTEYITVKSIIGDQVPPLKEMERAFLSSLFLASQQKSWTVLFTIGEKMRFQGCSDREIKGSGKVFKKKAIAEKSLFATIYHRFNKKRGRAYRESMGHLYSHLEIHGQGKGTLYEATIDHKNFPGLNIETGRVEQGRFVTIPRRYITDKGVGLYEKNFGGYLLSLKGFPEVTLTGLKILKKAGVSEAYLNRNNYCLDVVLRCLASAKKEGFNYNNLKNLPKDVKKWSIKLYSLKKKTKQLTEASRQLAKEIAEWQSRSVFNPELSFDEYQKRWENMIRKYGEQVIRKLFKGEISSYSPFPGNLWKKVKELKNTDP